MTKQQILDLIQLLSALESWGFSNKHVLPDFLSDSLADCIDALRTEILK